MKSAVKTLAIWLCVVVLQCLSGTGAKAQSNNPCIGWANNGCVYGWTSAPCPGWFNCYNYGPWLWTCQTWTNRCAPAVKDEVKQHCPVGGGPVCFADGNTYIEETDARIPGFSNGLSLVRTWNSIWPSTQVATQVGLFGPNWRSTYEERIFVGSDNYIRYARADGSFWSFATGGGGYVPVAPANVSAVLAIGWTLTFQNGEQRTFDFNSGSLTSITDPNGNKTTLSYDATNRLVTVTDPALRHLYFGYGNSTSRLVTSVTSDIGISLSYAYDSQGRLIQVTKPDQTTIRSNTTAIPSSLR